MANPIDNPDLYESLQVDGVRSPGQVTLTDHDRNQKVDVKDADGHGGASVTHKGEQLTQFQASFYLVKDPVLGADDFADWDVFSAKLRGSLPNTGKPKVLILYHPDLLANGITVATVVGISGMKHDGKGGATVVVKFVEHRPPKKKGGTPTGAATTKVDPNADLKAEIDSLLAKAKAA